MTGFWMLCFTQDGCLDCVSRAVLSPIPWCQSVLAACFELMVGGVLCLLTYAFCASLVCSTFVFNGLCLVGKAVAW